MTPVLIPAKSLKATCDSHLVEWQNTEVFFLDFLIPLDMVMNVLAAGMEIPDEQLRTLRVGASRI